MADLFVIHMSVGEIVAVAVFVLAGLFYGGIIFWDWLGRKVNKMWRDYK